MSKIKFPKCAFYLTFHLSICYHVVSIKSFNLKKGKNLLDLSDNFVLGLSCHLNKLLRKILKIRVTYGYAVMNFTNSSYSVLQQLLHNERGN